MSAIGDYIHLSAKGYQESGTRRPHWTPTTKPAEALSSIRGAIESQISTFGIIDKRTLANIENQMNKMIKATGEDRAFSVAADPEVIRQRIKAIIGKDIELLNNIHMDRLAIEKMLPPMTKISNNYARSKQWRNQIISKVNTLNAAIQQAQLMLDDKNGADAKILSNLLTQLEKLINDTYEKTYARLKDENVYVYKKDTTVKNLISKLNALIAQYNEMPIIDNKEGLLLKSILEVLPNASDMAVRKRLEEVLNVNNANFVIKNNNILTEASHKKKKVMLGDIEEIVTTKDNGVEISFRWKNKETMTAKVNNLNIVAGKYSFAGVGPDMSLDQLLKEKPSTIDFANHFYNVYTQHQDKNSSLLNSLRAEFISVVKSLAIYKAFDNEAFGKDKIFIYTVGGKQARVISTRELLLNLTKASEQLKSVTQNGASITRMKLLENKKVPNNISGQIRIANVLAEAHTRKISVALNTSVLEDAHKKR